MVKTVPVKNGVAGVSESAYQLTVVPAGTKGLRVTDPEPQRVVSEIWGEDGVCRSLAMAIVRDVVQVPLIARTKKVSETVVRFTEKVLPLPTGAPPNGASNHWKAGFCSVEFAVRVTVPGPQVNPFVVDGPGGLLVSVMITASREPSQLVSAMAT